MSKHNRSCFGLLLAVLLSVLPVGVGGAVSRDYLTPKEEEQVKLAQIIDERIDVFIKAADRRLMVLMNPADAASRQTAKEIEKWGELPKGTRVELIMDVANILDAAIINIDDLAARDEKNRLLPKALRNLAAASTRFQSQMTTMRGQTQDISEHRAIDQVLENVEAILDASARLPAEEKKK